MSHFRLLGRGNDFSRIIAELDALPELWGQDPERIEAENSPFVDTTDIWVRGLPRALLKQDRTLIAKPHFPEFYPSWEKLNEIRPLVQYITSKVPEWTGGVLTQLGAILITKVPVGVSIADHADQGWHPEWMNFKAHVALQSNDGCINTCELDRFNPKTGDIFTFNNLLNHSVQNCGSRDRLTMIVCMRVE